MIDYNQIIEDLEKDKIIALLQNLGAEEIIEREDFLITNTICHNESGGSLKLYYYYDTHIFYCYTDCQGMSIFNFLKTYYTNRGIEYNWNSDIVSVAINCGVGQEVSTLQISAPDRYRPVRARYKERKEQPTLNIYPEGVLDVFNKSYPLEWLHDRISKESMDKFNILYSISQNKIVIPHYDIDNRLVGIRGRTLDDWEIKNVGKYMPMQIEDKWYSHPLSLNLYGFNLSHKAIKETGVAYIFEGEKSCLQLNGFDMANLGVAVCGSQINKFQLDLLRRESQPREIIICFDNEEKRGEHKYFDKLYSLCEKYKNYAKMSFVYDREGLLDEQDSPTDKGEEIFQKLINGRVRVN